MATADVLSPTRTHVCSLLTKKFIRSVSRWYLFIYLFIYLLRSVSNLLFRQSVPRCNLLHPEIAEQIGLHANYSFQLHATDVC